MRRSVVVVWENADRHCNSPNDTSSGYCTLVSSGATMSTCVQPGIATAPLYGDCRWKTGNVSVHDSEFHVTPSNIGCTNDFCARQAMLSNYGTSPSWSPYMGFVVADAVNHFANDRHYGPWRFMAHDTSIDVDFAAWGAAPYAQDTGSTISP